MTRCKSFKHDQTRYNAERLGDRARAILPPFRTYARKNRDPFRRNIVADSSVSLDVSGNPMAMAALSASHGHDHRHMSRSLDDEVNTNKVSETIRNAILMP
jgi:hypothetical protein